MPVWVATSYLHLYLRSARALGGALAHCQGTAGSWEAQAAHSWAAEDQAMGQRLIIPWGPPWRGLPMRKQAVTLGPPKGVTWEMGTCLAGSLRASGQTWPSAAAPNSTPNHSDHQDDWA